MGEMSKRLAAEGALLKFDVGISLKYSGLPGKPEKDGDSLRLYNARAAKNTIRAVVQAKYVQGMDRAAGKYWAAWQEIIDDDSVVESVELTRGQLTWLYKIITEENLKVPFQVVQWREVLIDYLHGIIKDTQVTDSPTPLVAVQDV